ncbi:MAG: PqqD family protein [Deltaproteobacteria bacterium]|nr:PqqD family protein [Deltaproteobacteria bacterium]
MKRFPIKSKSTASKVLSDEAIVVNFQESFFYNLNPVGTFIWERCDGRHSVEEIAASLTEEYQVDMETATRDCRKFIDELVEQGILQWGEPLR